MKNVTISMDEKLARWVRIQAAEGDVSVSRFIRNLLEKNMESARAYSKAMQRNLSRKPRNISSRKPYPSREEIHERPVLR